jgi:hypothetical protein
LVLFGCYSSFKEGKGWCIWKTFTASIIKLFYLREDISRSLPTKHYTTKHGVGYVLQQTLKTAFRIFKLENPDINAGYTKFTQLRPTNVRLISNQFLLHLKCTRLKTHRAL